MNDSSNLRQALEHIHSLPPIPKIAQEILSLKLLSEEGEQALLELIKQDPAISAKVIGLANSPLFGTSRKIASVSEAAALLGIRRIKMTALSFAMMAAITRTPTGVLNANNLWQHSLAVAMTLHSMAQYLPAGSRPAAGRRKTIFSLPACCTTSASWCWTTSTRCSAISFMCGWPEKSNQPLRQ